MLARDRAGEARAAFDEAVKIDPRNVTALVGQGEVLYADGRYTEALTRFDEAVVEGPDRASPPTIGAAKTKIALERLADAKTQLTAARATAPKDMGVALWLAQGRGGARQQEGRREALRRRRSISPTRRTPTRSRRTRRSRRSSRRRASAAEAQAKLDQARAKLPDTRGAPARVRRRRRGAGPLRRGARSLPGGARRRTRTTSARASGSA